MPTEIVSQALLDILVKTTLLLVSVGVGAMLLCRSSAAARHRWWSLGFGACLLVPLISCFGPAWMPPFAARLTPAWLSLNARTHSMERSTDDPFTHAKDGVAKATAGSWTAVPRPRFARYGTLDPNAKPSLHETPPTWDHKSSNSNVVTSKIENQAADSISERNQHTSPAVVTLQNGSTQTAREIFWPRVLLSVWCVGFIAMLFKNVWQQGLLCRMLRECKSVGDSDWSRLLRECSESLGLRRRVGLLEHTANHSPVSARIWRPVVVLPSDARNWNAERRRLVLLHELAHVMRRDVLTRSVAALACAMCWFNPIAWHGLHQMRKLRELACDDLVLGCGQKPSRYANVLLAIARSYRHRSCSASVGMARSNHVERRILAILDMTRKHVRLSPGMARLLFAFAAALTCLAGTAQFRSLPEVALAAAEEEIVAPVANVAVDDPLRTMEIHILDDEGRPLAGATLTAAVWYLEGYEGERTAKHHTADKNGVVMLRVPKRLRILRLWPKLPGYVGQFHNFAKGTHEEGKLIPDKYVFHLPKGHSIGGQIVDEEGNPIEGVHVRVKVGDTLPGVSTRLTDSFDQPTVKTDADGRWQLNNAPAHGANGNECTFELKLSHDDYVTDKYWGTSQRAQGVETADLRSQEAKIVLYRGTSIHGPVVDLDGMPITQGWVVWNDSPYLSDGVCEAELKQDGTFATPPLPDGEHPITIVAPGFAAQRRIVHVGSDPNKQPFYLRPGNRIAIQFVDANGDAVPGVYVGLASSSVTDTWQNSNALHNHKHSSVPDYGVPRQADENGVYVWNWAPDEPVKYSASTKGFAPAEFVLVPKTEPHTITLAAARVVVGQVTDATTRQPIPAFRVMPVIEYRPEFCGTRFVDLKRGVDGRYELPLTGSGDPESRYRVRFEAVGYRSEISQQTFGPLDGQVELNMQLQPVPMRQGRVVDVDGQPVADADILIGTPTWVPRTHNGESSGYGERVLKTDDEGRFELHATTEVERVRAFNETGIVEKLVQPDEAMIGELTLQPWAKVSGRLLQDGEPVGNQSIYFHALFRRGLGEPRFQDSYNAITKPDGSFVFQRLPPGSGSLSPYLGPWRDSPLTSANRLPLVLAAGEQRQVIFGGAGAVITGQVIATGREDVPLDRNWSLNYLISRDRGVSIPERSSRLSFDPSDPVQSSWALDPHFGDWLGSRENHFVKLASDGTLRVTGVAPGDYDLMIRLFEQPTGCLVESVGEKIVPVRVKDEGWVELGRIEVPCRAGPRPGSDMRAFEFVNEAGRRVSVNDMSGRYILMHVWASWCPACLQSMPDIKQYADEFSERGDVMFAGLNVDADITKARELAKQNELSWSQTYLGDRSDVARQLAISSVPTYYLIGPDGKLMESAMSWGDIKPRLNELRPAAVDAGGERTTVEVE